jgi:hypothetical protein
MRTSSSERGDRASPLAPVDPWPTSNAAWMATAAASAVRNGIRIDRIALETTRPGPRTAPASVKNGGSYWTISRQLIRLPVGGGVVKGIPLEAPVPSENWRSPISRP